MPATELVTQTVVNPPKVDLEEAAKGIKVIGSEGEEVPLSPVKETDANVLTLHPVGPEEVLTTGEGMVVIRPAEPAEEGETPLAETKPTLTKDVLKGMLEEILEEQKEEADKAALRKAVEDAAAGSLEARELAGKACHGVECLQQAISTIGEKIDEFKNSVEVAPEPAPAPPIEPVVAAPVVVPTEPVQAQAPAEPPMTVQPAVEEHDHNHDHPAHLTSASMAEGVLDRIMSCEQCSPSMKKALIHKLHKYIDPEDLKRLAGMFGEEATVGEDRREAEEEAQPPEEEQHPVAGGEELAAQAEAKAEAGADAGAGSDEPVGEPAADGDSAAPAGAADGAAAQPAAESSDSAAPPAESATDPDTERRKAFRDPLGYI